MQRHNHSFAAMGGPCTLRVDCDDSAVVDDAMRAAELEVRRLEQKYSRYLPASVTAAINRGAGNGPLTIDGETAGLLRHADILWRESGGLFDLTSGVLRQAWDFKSGRLPSRDQLASLLVLVGWQRVSWSDTAVSLPQRGMELDFGGCVKEYACDSAAAVLRRCGVAHALVDLAGDMTAVGGQGSGLPWPVGIRRPDGGKGALAQIQLQASALASSGDYERCMVVDGRRYGHILNPETGWPVRGLRAVSVSAEQCLVAGSAATVAMLKPAEDALCWLAELGLPWLAVDEDMAVHGHL